MIATVTIGPEIAIRSNSAQTGTGRLLAAPCYVPGESRQIERMARASPILLLNSDKQPTSLSASNGNAAGLKAGVTPALCYGTGN
jgi:hypothetical protein